MNEKNGFRALAIIAAAILGGIISVGASAKSMYVIAGINGSPTPIHSYELGAAPNVLTFQAEDTIPRLRGGAVGIAIDEASKKLFVTYEVSNTIQLVDAINFSDLGTTTAPGAGNLAGIVFHQAKKRIYTVDRGTNKLYVYDWVSATNTATQVMGPGPNGEFPLLGVGNAFGLALDEGINDRLYVADGSLNIIYYFDTVNFAQQGMLPVIAHRPISIALDQTKQFLYTGSGFSGGDFLVKTDVQGILPESTVDVTAVNGGTDGVVGVAVDEATGNVYVTTGDSNPSESLIAFDSNLNLLQQLTDAQIQAAGGTNWDDPTGLVIPRTEITFGVSAQLFKGKGGKGSAGPLELLLGLLVLPLVLARRGARRGGMLMLAVGLLGLAGCAADPYKPWQPGDSLWEKEQQAGKAAMEKERQAESEARAAKEQQAAQEARAAEAAMAKERQAKREARAKAARAKEQGAGRKWYVGAGIGHANTDASSSSHDRNLAGLGYTAVSDLDNTSSGWKLFGGYEFTRKWAIEGTYVDLGEITSDTTVSAGPPGWTPQNFVNAASTKHPYSVNGLAITGKGTYPIWSGFDAFAKLGLFLWDADINVKCAVCIPPAKSPGGEHGVDFTFGVGVGYDFLNDLGIRIEWERFSTDRDDVDLLSASGLYRF